MAPGMAFAHTGPGDVHDFVHGFMHPLGGFDHLVAMVAVGVLAAQLGGRALWLIPAAFVATMAVTGTLGAAGVEIPFVESGIALSVLVLGAAIAFEVALPIAGAAVLVAFFAIFHGYAHGAEIPASISGTPYGLGFVAATALLHGCGIALGLLLGGAEGGLGRRLVRLAGGAAAITGVVLMASAA